MNGIGASNLFAKEEEYGISVHWTNKVENIDGESEKLIQYSYLSLKKDALEWLKKNGRLPTTSINQYFREINTLNSQFGKIEELTSNN